MKRRKETVTFNLVVIYGVIACMGIGLSYMSFALVWNMKAEVARQADITYQNRSSAAEASIGDLKRTIQMLGFRSSIDSWAHENGYILGNTVSGGSVGGSSTSVVKQ